MGALVTGAAVVTGALVLGTVVVVGATVVVVGAAEVELGTAGVASGCQDCESLKCIEGDHNPDCGQTTHLRSLSLEDVFCLRWHPAQQ